LEYYWKLFTMSLIFPKFSAQMSYSRRQFLQFSGMAGSSLLLGGCASSFMAKEVGQLSEPLNQTLEALMLSQKPVPEYPMSAIEPDKLLINSFAGNPTNLNLNQFQLKIDGDVQKPMTLSMAEIQQMPLTSMVIRHVCVEGWAAVVQWGGVRVSDLLALVQPNANARYVYFASADGYYESWDLASVVHPQTLMAYQKNGAPLPLENGAPLRLAAPIKLGYKQSKWVTQLTVLSELTARRGYWVDKGYEWFAGL
jgi:DMSO/TMAO reductase YedYZ molybdopterin-dependent catalytic subunit